MALKQRPCCHGVTGLSLICLWGFSSGQQWSLSETGRCFLWPTAKGNEILLVLRKLCVMWSLAVASSFSLQRVRRTLNPFRVVHFFHSVQILCFFAFWGNDAELISCKACCAIKPHAHFTTMFYYLWLNIMHLLLKLKYLCG